MRSPPSAKPCSPSRRWWPRPARRSMPAPTGARSRCSGSGSTTRRCGAGRFAGGGFLANATWPGRRRSAFSAPPSPRGCFRQPIQSGGSSASATFPSGSSGCSRRRGPTSSATIRTTSSSCPIRRPASGWWGTASRGCTRSSSPPGASTGCAARNGRSATSSPTATGSHRGSRTISRCKTRPRSPRPSASSPA